MEVPESTVTALHTEAQARFAEFLPKVATLASPLRAQLFKELLALVDAMETPAAQKLCYLKLWPVIETLAASDRAEAAIALAWACLKAGHLPYPELSDAFGFITVKSDQPKILGLLSTQLIECSESEFAVTQQALFNKIDRLQAQYQCQALLSIHDYLIKFWDRYCLENESEIEDRENRYQQIFQSAYACIARLPPEQQILAIGKWTALRPSEEDYRARDDMTINLLRLIPANAEASPQVVQAIVHQLKSNFSWDAEANSIARYRALLGAIQHHSPACQAAVLQCWISEDRETNSGDLQWQAMSEACAALPDPQKGAVLVSLAEHIGMVDSAFYWARDDMDGRNTGDSALELASHIEEGRKEYAARHVEKYSNASEEYYQSSCLASTAALSACAKLAAQVPKIQRIEILEKLFASNNYGFSLSLARMDASERAACTKELRSLIDTLSDAGTLARLQQALDAQLR